MKSVMTRIFWPILRLFETDKPSANYRKSHRVALNVLGTLFTLLSLGSAIVGYSSGELGAFIPVVAFFCIGTVALAVGLLGSDGAVSKVWGTR
ncbi:MAG: hypothetical protein CME36_16155 [unclassified Hahellaceae]|nr:hypothetical protein [Hahellaceae bacterium]